MFGLSSKATGNIHFIQKMNETSIDTLNQNNKYLPKYDLDKDYNVNIFPEEDIYNENKILAWLESIGKYNKKRMDKWREIKLKYKTIDEFLKSNENKNDFINCLEIPYEKIDLSKIKKNIKKVNKLQNNNISDNNEQISQPIVKPIIDYNKYALDPIKPKPIIIINNTINNTNNNNDINNEIYINKLKHHYDYPPCIMIWASDLIGTPIMVNSPKNKLVAKIMSIRHEGITFGLDAQIIANGLPRNVRAGGKQFILFPTEDQKTLKLYWEEVCSSFCSFKDFQLFINNILDGEDIKFIMIDRLEKPTQIRLNWTYIDDAKNFIKKTVDAIKFKENNKKRKLIEYNNNIHNKNKKNRQIIYDSEKDNIFLLK